MDALCEGEKEGSHMSGYGVNVSHDSAMTEEAERKRRQNEGKALPCSHLTESYRMGGCACGDGGGGDGPSTLIVVILVVGMVGIVVAVGWQMWKTHKAAKGAAAAGSAVDQRRAASVSRKGGGGNGQRRGRAAFRDSRHV